MTSKKTSPSSSRIAFQFLAPFGLLLIAAAVVIPIFSGGFPESNVYKWIFSAGAAVSIIAALFQRTPEGASLRDRRWARIEGWSAIFFCVAAFFMWYPGSSPRDWLAFTLAGAFIRIIVFFRNMRSTAH